MASQLAPALMERRLWCSFEIGNFTDILNECFCQCQSEKVRTRAEGGPTHPDDSQMIMMACNKEEVGREEQSSPTFDLQ